MSKHRKDKSDKKNYRTLQYSIKENDEIFSYCDNMCFLSKNMYNVTNFYIRQCMTGVKKSISKRTENEKLILGYVKNAIAEHNGKRLEKYFAEKNDKGWNKKGNAFTYTHKPTKKHWMLSYETLDNVFKTTKNLDYYAMPSQANQQTIKDVIEAWDSYFELNAKYKEDASSLNGKPKIPKYADKNGRRVITMSKQIAKIHKDEQTGKYYIQFPKDKTDKGAGALTYIIGKTLPNGLNIDQYQEARIVPKGGCYVLEIIFCLGKKEEVKRAHKRIAGIDLGVNNFITMADNTGKAPVIIKGGIIKSRNQFYNKLRAQYMSILRNGKKSNEGPYTSKRLQKLDRDRNNFIKDYLHKASRAIVNVCIERDIDTIVIGKNTGWKKEINNGSVNNQNFVMIPYAQLIDMITYKANGANIEVILTEESYTSKASFLDRDEMPVYGKDNDIDYQFSGKRYPRGVYTTKDGTYINSDVNGAANIMRKVFPMVGNHLTDRGVLNAPAMLSVA